MPVTLRGTTIKNVTSCGTAGPSPPPVLWTPADLGAALALWLDASDATTVTESGGFVSQWDDKSGNGRDFTQGVAGTEPAYSLASINGLNTLSFDGTDDSIARVAESWAYNYPINVFTVFKATAFNASYNGLFGFYTASDATTAGFGAFIKSDGLSAIYATDTSDGQPNYDGTGALTYALNTGYIFGATIGDDLITSFGDGTADGTASGTWALRNNIGPSLTGVSPATSIGRFQGCT